MGLRPREIHLLILTIDLILLNLSFVLGRVFIHEGSLNAIKPLWSIMVIGYMLISPMFVEDLRNFKIDYLRMTRSNIRRFVYYFSFCALVLICCESPAIPRKQFLATLFLFFFFKMAISTWYFFRFSFFKTHLYLKPTVIIGNNRLGNQLYNYFKENRYLGIKPIGLISETPIASKEGNLIGSVEEFQDIFDEKPFEDAFIVVSLSNEQLITTIISAAERNGVRTHVVPNYLGNTKMNFKTANIGIVPLLEMHSFPLDIYSNRFLKRAFDIVFSLIVMVLFFPVGLLIALIIKLTSKGPVFFQTYRLGVTGIVFKIYKFRTMYYDPSGNSHTKSTVLNDERITPFGRILRKFSLDEMPQFLNVLNNEMAVVGPRPHRLNLNKDLQQKMGSYMMRHTIKPGITGWAQVNGWRGPTNTKIQYWGRTLHDLWYIEHWNLGLDIYIILLTVFGRKSKKNAF